MNKTVLILGGCRSGKSHYALELAAQWNAKRKLFVATCIPHDEEMKNRIAQHQAERSSSWTTLEEPLNVPEIIRTESRQQDLILVDCLTLWVSNLMMETDPSAQIDEYIERLSLAIESVRCPLLLVANEVGMGIVPENPLARRFRDVAGLVNQRVAQVVDHVVLSVAGIPLPVKGGEIESLT